MDVRDIIEAIAKWAALFQAELERMEAGMVKRIDALQKSLLDELAALIGWFDFDGKMIENTPKNIGQLRRLEGFLDKIKRDRIDDELRVFAKELMGTGDLTVQYYRDTGNAEQAVQESVIDSLRNVIGVDARGNLLRGGYLDNLGRASEVRAQLRDYVLKSIVSKRSLSDFQKGLSDLIVGNDSVDGALIRYWRQYAFDTFNQVHEVANKTMADGLGLKYFIYQGSVIPNTRQFCRKKVGKVFSTIEAEKWKDDPDLIDQKTKAQYNPLLERGRYNCRHFLNYISDEVAVELRPDLKK